MKFLDETLKQLDHNQVILNEDHWQSIDDIYDTLKKELSLSFSKDEHPLLEEYDCHPGMVYLLILDEHLPLEEQIILPSTFLKLCNISKKEDFDMEAHQIYSFYPRSDYTPSMKAKIMDEIKASLVLNKHLENTHRKLPSDYDALAIRYDDNGLFLPYQRDFYDQPSPWNIYTDFSVKYSMLVTFFKKSLVKLETTTKAIPLDLSLTKKALKSGDIQDDNTAINVSYGNYRNIFLQEYRDLYQDGEFFLYQPGRSDITRADDFFEPLITMDRLNPMDLFSEYNFVTLRQKEKEQRNNQLLYINGGIDDMEMQQWIYVNDWLRLTPAYDMIDPHYYIELWNAIDLFVDDIYYNTFIYGFKFSHDLGPGKEIGFFTTTTTRWKAMKTFEIMMGRRKKE